MAQKISDLRDVNKSGETSREYLLLSNIDNRNSSKISLNDVLPTLQSGKTSGSVTAGTNGNTVQDLFVGGGIGSATTGTDKSVLIFKGLNAEDTYSALTIRTDTGTADSSKKNLVLKLNHSNIRLDQANNATAQFLSKTGGSNGLDLGNNTHYTGQLGVAGGGTGAATLTDHGLLVGSGTGAVTALSAMAKGSLLVGIGASSDPTIVNVGTNGFTLIADSNEASGLKWGKVSISEASLTNNLITNNNNISLGTGWLAGTTNYNAGIRLSSSNDYVYVGGGSSYYNSFLNVEGGITLGSSTGTAASTVKASDCSSGASPTLTVQGSNNTDGNVGGKVVIQAGSGNTNGNGGDVEILGGAKAGSGTDGDVVIKTGGTVGLTVNQDQDTVLGGKLVVPVAKGIGVKGTAVVTQATSITTGVTLNSAAGVISLHATAFAAAAEQEFTLTNSVISSTSIVLLTMQQQAAATEGDGATLVATLGGSPGSGNCKIRITNPGSAISSAAAKVNFLVINVS